MEALYSFFLDIITMLIFRVNNCFCPTDLFINLLTLRVRGFILQLLRTDVILAAYKAFILGGIKLFAGLEYWCCFFEVVNTALSNGAESEFGSNTCKQNR